MKLALVIERFDPQGGGAERSTAQIAQEFIKRGHRVVVLAGIRGRDAPPNVPPEPPESPGLEVKHLLSAGRFGAMRLLRFNRWARAELAAGGFDASLSVTTTVPAMVLQPRSGTLRETFDRNIAMRASAGARLRKRLGLAVSPKHRALLHLERQTLADPAVRRVAAVSRYVSDQLQRHYGFDPAKIEVIPNAATMPEAAAGERAAWRKQVRESFGVPPGAVVFLFAAHNPRLKGVHTLIAAASLLKKRGLDFVVLLAGQIGYAQQHQAASLGVRDRLRIVGPTSQMAPLYAASDVMVHPTFYDPSSKVVIESLMMGVPAISTTFNGASDFIVSPGVAPRGRVIADPADAAALAEAMMELTDPQARARCQAACAGLADELSMARHVDQLESLIRRAQGS